MDINTFDGVDVSAHAQMARIIEASLEVGINDMNVVDVTGGVRADSFGLLV